MSRFYFGGSDSGSDDENPLPFPKPLARSAFLAPDFSPNDFLSSLHNRHQTLEDLRLELRTRSQELHKELLDLVNDNYQDFLGLGDSLKGGEEKVEEVRLGLLGFKRDIDSMQGRVVERRKEVQELVTEKRNIAKKVQVGRRLLEVNSGLEELEESLSIGTNTVGQVGQGLDLDFSESENGSDDEDELGTTVPLSRLRRRTQQYINIKKLINKIGPTHPFLSKQEDRVLRVRQALLLDLRSALRQVRQHGGQNGSTALKILGMYQDMDDSAEALGALRDQRQ